MNNYYARVTLLYRRNWNIIIVKDTAIKIKRDGFLKRLFQGNLKDAYIRTSLVFTC